MSQEDKNTRDVYLELIPGKCYYCFVLMSNVRQWTAQNMLSNVKIAKG